MKDYEKRIPWIQEMRAEMVEEGYGVITLRAFDRGRINHATKTVHYHNSWLGELELVRHLRTQTLNDDPEKECE